MVREYFQKFDPTLDVKRLNDRDKTKLMLDRLLKGEIDIETYKRSLDLIHGKHKGYGDLGYI